MQVQLLLVRGASCLSVMLLAAAVLPQQALSAAAELHLLLQFLVAALWSVLKQLLGWGCQHQKQCENPQGRLAAAAVAAAAALQLQPPSMLAV